MRAGALARDSVPQLLGLSFTLLFSAALLSVLGVPAAAIFFLCLVLLICGLLPMALSWTRRARFYQETEEALDALEEKYLLSALMDAPGFAEGDFLCAAMAEVNQSMAGRVSAAKRDAAEYREYIETWIHEVKTPIAAARLALENDPGPLAERLEEEIFRIDGYVEQALFYARSGAVERDYLIKALPLREAAASAVKKYARPLITAGFHIDLDALTATVYSDPMWVGFILGQLISNAVKYRGQDPVLRFTQREEAAGVVLGVADSGQGIPAADLPRVFDKGFTGANGRSGPGRATGLGLYLCKKLCGRLNLGLTIQSQEGRGTLVEITFPKGRFHLAE